MPLSDLLVDNVVKRFGRVTALDGMTFDVKQGEFYCLLGPSSAGKTTMLRAISGLEQLDSGKITLAGRDMVHAPVQGRGISMIFQTFALYPHLTVRRNFAYPLVRAGVETKEIERRVGEVAEMLRVKHTLDRLPSTLSGGEQQRVAIGRALIRRPKLLLLDEPLTNLDAKLRHDTRAEFKRLHRELGMTMLYATPDQLEALTMGQRVGVMRHGRIVDVGDPRDLYARPGTTYVAGMVGSPAINLIPGKVSRQAGGIAIDLPFGTLPAGRWQGQLDDGAPVLFGMRPHDVLLGRVEARGPTFPAKIHLTEPLGDVTLLDLDMNGAGLKMALPEERALGLGLGSTIDVTLSADDVHLFHAETGVRLN